MYDYSVIVNSLYGLVGYDNPADPNYSIVDADNLDKRSGRSFNDNSFCKIEWFIDNGDYPGQSSDQVNDDLKACAQLAIKKVCDKVFSNPDFIDRQMLYQFPNNKTAEDTLLPNTFVGYKIRTALEKNTSFRITRDILEFNGTGDITIYLFNTAQKTPIANKTITITSANQSADIGFNVNYNAAYSRGDFYYGYLADQAIANGLTPVKRDYQNANIKSVITYQCWENVSAPNVTSAELWDLETNDGASECWGLNPDVTVYYDYTNLIIQNETLFAEAIQLQGHINFLEKIRSSTRSNIDERISNDIASKILAEIEGVYQTNKVGLKNELNYELGKVRKAVAKLKDGYFARGITLNTRY